MNNQIRSSIRQQQEALQAYQRINHPHAYGIPADYIPDGFASTAHPIFFHPHAQLSKNREEVRHQRIEYPGLCDLLNTIKFPQKVETLYTEEKKIKKSKISDIEDKKGVISIDLSDDGEDFRKRKEPEEKEVIKTLSKEAQSPPDIKGINHDIIRNEEEIDSDDGRKHRCIICIGSTYKNPVTLCSCYHTFCLSCILKWFRVSRRCPLCKTPAQFMLGGKDEKDAHLIEIKLVEYKDTERKRKKDSDIVWTNSSKWPSRSVLSTAWKKRIEEMDFERKRVQKKAEKKRLLKAEENKRKREEARSMKEKKRMEAQTQREKKKGKERKSSKKERKERKYEITKQRKERGRRKKVENDKESDSETQNSNSNHSIILSDNQSSRKKRKRKTAILYSDSDIESPDRGRNSKRGICSNEDGQRKRNRTSKTPSTAGIVMLDEDSSDG